jgi:hypothetical protein
MPATRGRSPARLPAAALAAAALTALTGCTSTHHHPATPGTSTAATGAPAPATVPAERLTTLGHDLTSTNPATVRAALDPAVYAALRAGGHPLLPTGSRLHLDPATLKVTGHTATVTGTVTGPRTGTFTLGLALEGSTWVVYTATPA